MDVFVVIVNIVDILIVKKVIESLDVDIMISSTTFTVTFNNEANINMST